MRQAPDPYFPTHGDQRYTVEHYDLTLRYKVATNRLNATATLRVRALEDCPDLRLDLSGLHVDGLRVDGSPVPYRHVDRAVTLKLPAPLPSGAVCRVEVRYSGKPTGVPGPFGPAGWEELEDGLLVASQPYGAPSWFPCNDFAGDKATFRFEVSCENPYIVVANGTFVDRRRSGADTTWVYEETHPMAPYLAALHIGRYAVTPLASGRPPIDLVAVPSFDAEGTPFERVPDMVDHLAEWYGPYPFDEYRCVVTPDVLEIPLEAQGLASFGSNHARDWWPNERLVVHELAHQWFGNSVTAGSARDIWLHEGFACYTEWLWSEVRGQGTAAEQARRHHAQLARVSGFALTDPGVRSMFDDEVYKRGALTVHALRRRLGDEAFFPLVRGWCTEHADAVVTTDDFVAYCARSVDADLADLWNAWLYSPALPAFPA